MSLIIFSDPKHYIPSLFVDHDVTYDFVKWMRSHPGSLYHKSMLYRIYAKHRYHNVYDVPERKCDIRVKILLKIDHTFMFDVTDCTNYFCLYSQSHQT